jgi:hypothetical protein
MNRKLLWCPIDIPKFPLPDLDLSPTADWEEWQFLRLTNKKNSAYDVSELSDFTRANLPELVEWLNHFPIKSIRNIKFNVQKNAVHGHIDFVHPSANAELFKNNSDNEPCGYRVLISGKRSNGFYVVRNGEKIHTVIPDETNVYVLGGTNVEHGVEADPGRKTMYLHFEIDADAHKVIIDRSLAKFGQYAVFE